MLAATPAPLGQRHVPVISSSQRPPQRSRFPRLPRDTSCNLLSFPTRTPGTQTPTRSCCCCPQCHSIRMETFLSPKSHHRLRQLLPLLSALGAPGAPPGCASLGI